MERFTATSWRACGKSYPGSAKLFEEMQEEESGHRSRLLDLYRDKFGDHIPHIRREDVKGFVARRPVWLIGRWDCNVVRRQAEIMELETRQFYERAANRTTDVSIRKLLGDLAIAERKHSAIAESLEHQLLTPDVVEEEDAAQRRLFVLQIVQPGLAGLMDGSVSTLAPVFAAAFATKNSWDAFLVGMAASVGAGISMGFAEALSDDGSLTGRGHPWIRGAVCGVMTTAGGIGHTLPFLIRDFRVAMAVAVLVVIAELFAISLIRNRYMDTPFVSAALQVVVGGALGVRRRHPDRQFLKTWRPRSDLRGEKLVREPRRRTLFQRTANWHTVCRLAAEGLCAGRNPTFRGPVRLGETAGRRREALSGRRAEVFEGVRARTPVENRAEPKLLKLPLVRFGKHLSVGEDTKSWREMAESAP